MKKVAWGWWLICLLGAKTGQAEEFSPRIVKIVPLAEKVLDLELLAAGSPTARARRADELMASLKPLEKLDPLQEGEEVLKWVGAVALWESLVRDTDTPDAEARGKLLDLYMRLAAAEGAFAVYWRAMRYVTLQPGTAGHASVRLAEQLYSLPAYCREAVRWLANLERQTPPARDYSLKLLRALALAERKDGHWEKLRAAAAQLCSQEKTCECLGWQAEALFELDRQGEAESIMRQGGKEWPDARRRGRLWELRRSMAAGRAGRAEMIEAGKLLLELGEPGRVLELLKWEKVLPVADGELDEIYLEALFQHGMQLEQIWKYGLQARGEATPRSLGRRISAGLVRVLDSVYRQRVPEATVLERVRRDLAAFRPSDPEATDLAALNLLLLEIAVRGGGDPGRLEKLAGQITDFRRLYPDNPKGLELLLLAAQLGAKVSDPWREAASLVTGAERLAAAEQLVPVLAGAAVRRALRERTAEPLAQALASLEKMPAGGLALLLWRGHLLTLQGLLSASGKGDWLRPAVQAYTRFIESYQDSSEGMRPEDLCDAVLALATLVMQSGQPAQAADLLEQAKAVCGGEAAVGAARAVLALVMAREKQAIGQALAELSTQAARLESRPIALQATLWLALALEAAEKKDQARATFERAAELARQMKENGEPPVLAPEPLSLAGFFGVLDVHIGYSSSSPFGVVTEVGIRPRLLFFPPAAADARRLAPYLEQSGGK